MLFANKVVLWVMQRPGLPGRTELKGRISRVLFCSKADCRSANLTSEVIFFNEIVRVASSANACELTE